jgi:hypothetical protein
MSNAEEIAAAFERLDELLAAATPFLISRSGWRRVLRFWHAALASIAPTTPSWCIPIRACG